MADPIYLTFNVEDIVVQLTRQIHTISSTVSAVYFVTKFFYQELRIAGQTAGLIGLKFCVHTHGWPGGFFVLIHQPVHKDIKSLKGFFSFQTQLID